MTIPVSKLVLRYLVWVGIPYLMARQIEKRIITPYLENDKNVRRFPNIEDISEETRNGLDGRGGGAPAIWISKIILDNFAIKVALASLFGSTIYSDTADNAAAQLLKYAGPLMAAPGKRFKRLIQRIKGIDPKAEYSKDIREILLDKELKFVDKVDLLKLKVEHAFTEFKGPKRRQFIVLATATIVFTIGGNVGAFGVVMNSLRDFLGRSEDDESLKHALIEVYKEYNAPFPPELLPEPIKESIKNIQ